MGLDEVSACSLALLGATGANPDGGGDCSVPSAVGQRLALTSHNSVTVALLQVMNPGTESPSSLPKVAENEVDRRSVAVCLPAGLSSSCHTVPVPTEQFLGAIFTCLGGCPGGRRGGLQA